ncbi:UDP-N-acetylmuramoylalanine--D-glutamate ligase [Usitatibacter palustris]|uniref:UDP-N-acetylmuramoylalanine--D-glutamate ligase n=1 Tax=Usitatibacter palustris TaxID=2732487 RepID=A0A6M4H3I8_9PROT|nr:UDP-N-acetylmuramoyl-L-alanine--D-glutamate ligase [Usitatibacter palustris]QJR13852.1 UDP-N-acetylmuramoylalanine--D-glutamate ligase [Usitatibacter palustris]
MDWEGKGVLVLGLGETGLSGIRWLASKGANLRAADTRQAPPALAEVRRIAPGVRIDLGPFAPSLLEGVDTILASPGLALRDAFLRDALARGVEVVGDIEIFGRELARHRKARVLGVTGTNGKSTVTSLADAMCRAAGRRSVACGNVGVPVLDCLATAETFGHPDVYVVELSSYQLETTSSLELDAGAVLNVTQDHLDRYDSMQDYAAAKARIFAHCKTRIVNREDAVTLAMAEGHEMTSTFGLDAPKNEREWGLDAARANLMRGDRSLLPVADVAIPGLHNAANALAAHALCSAIDLPEAPLATAIRAFRGLPHRVELVAEAGGVRFYNDSKGTNVGAAVAALEGFTSPVVLIAGGDGKQQDFSPLAAAVKAKARAVVLIGRDAPAIATALAGTGVPLVNATSMEDAVGKARFLAVHGDAVLLSPACASFDMFRNYGHRGEVFAAAARALVGATH